MKFNPQFAAFVGQIAKKSGQYALCESIMKGYKICCESMDTTETITLEVPAKEYPGTESVLNSLQCAQDSSEPLTPAAKAFLKAHPGLGRIVEVHGNDDDFWEMSTDHDIRYGRTIPVTFEKGDGSFWSEPDDAEPALMESYNENVDNLEEGDLDKPAYLGYRDGINHFSSGSDIYADTMSEDLWAQKYDADYQKPWLDMYDKFSKYAEIFLGLKNDTTDRGMSDDPNQGNAATHGTCTAFAFRLYRINNKKNVSDPTGAHYSSYYRDVTPIEFNLKRDNTSKQCEVGVHTDKDIKKFAGKSIGQCLDNASAWLINQGYVGYTFRQDGKVPPSFMKSNYSCNEV